MNPKFSRHLKQRGLLPSTRDKYAEILAGAGTEDLLTWIRSRVHARTPVGTLLPMRAAVKHYLVGVLGYDEDEVRDLLPRARGREASLRLALTPRQLALYHAAVEGVDVEPAHTILSLLPLTGQRIGEITALQVSDIHRADGRYFFVFRGKGDRERIVPLNRAGEQILLRYLEKVRPKKWLFEGYSGGPIGPHAVRRYTRRIAADYPDLAGLSPHVLRHTAATLWLRRGVDIKAVQQLLGHKSIATTQRYLHLTPQDLLDAIDRV